MLYPASHLYFTAFVDEEVDGFEDRDPEEPVHLSTCHPALIGELLDDAGREVARSSHRRPCWQRLTSACRGGRTLVAL